jgi:hypothetical protein
MFHFRNTIGTLAEHWALRFDTGLSDSSCADRRARLPSLGAQTLGLADTIPLGLPGMPAMRQFSSPSPLAPLVPGGARGKTPAHRYNNRSAAEVRRHPAPLGLARVWQALAISISPLRGWDLAL